MPAAGVELLITVVAIVLVLVFYLVSTILALRQITAGLDAAIGSVKEIIEKSAPVEEIVTSINTNLDAGGRPRDNANMAWAGRCAYVAGSGGAPVVPQTPADPPVADRDSTTRPRTER